MKKNPYAPPTAEAATATEASGKTVRDSRRVAFSLMIASALVALLTFRVPRPGMSIAFMCMGISVASLLLYASNFPKSRRGVFASALRVLSLLLYVFAGLGLVAVLVALIRR